MSDEKPSARKSFSHAALGKNGEFTIGLSEKKLDDIIGNKMRRVSFDVPPAAYDGLSDANKRALSHLVRASIILNDVYLKMDHPDNIRARDLLVKEADKGNTLAQKALLLFRMHNGLEGRDLYAKKPKPLRIFSDKKQEPGKGFYPRHMTVKKLADYVLAHPEQASAIFSNNTIVRREGKRLAAVPYSVAFRAEMEGAAAAILAAAKETDHEGFAKYLRWQAQQLVNDSDPEMGYKADKAWAGLEDSPLEFTIGRESYEDRLSSATEADPRVKAMLEANGIKAKAKDVIGARVGIVNRDSFAEIVKYHENIPGFSREFPLRGEFAQQAAGKINHMAFADVDLVSISGRYACHRGAMTSAQNLPNDDKLVTQLKDGSRMVFHRQVRASGDPAQRRKFLDALIDPAQQAWYDENARFRFVVGHESSHSEGPRATLDGRDKKAALGQYGDMLEENKADVASIAMTEYLVRQQALTQEQANGIYLTWAADCLPTKQPGPDEAHKSRSLMQLNYFIEQGAILFEKGGKLSVVPEKMPAVARQMLAEVVRLQLDGDPEKAGAFVKKYAAWSDADAYAAAERMKLKPKLYMLVEQPGRALAAPAPA